MPMKQPFRLPATIASVLSATCLGACHSPQPGLTAPLPTAHAQHAPSVVPPVGVEPHAPTSAERPREEPRPNCCTNPRQRDPLDDPNSPLAQRDIFFAFDQHQLTADTHALLEHHARYLVSRPQRRLRLEGHADARGSREYNLALGQMRAQAVYRRLMLLGVREAQLDAESWGKERPRVPGADEAAWAQNRRVDLVYVR
jgi:peptidoglycan-associated lipoprotein